MLRHHHFKDRLTTKTILIFVILVLVVVYSFLFPFKKTYANEITLFPSVCEGNWLNTTAATGDPTDAIDGAQSVASGDTITCHSFTGETLPNGVNITSAHIEFVWGLKPSGQEVLTPSIEDSYDAVPTPITSVEELKPSEENSTPQESLPTPNPTEEVPSVEETPEETPQAPSTTEPTSYFHNWNAFFIIPTAQAEETISTPEPVLESTNTSSEPQTVDNSEEPANFLIESSPSAESNISTTTEHETETSQELNVSNQPQDNISEHNPLSSKQENSGNEKIISGTPLFTITATLPDQGKNVLGSIMQEQLSAKYPLTITAPEITDLQISLTSLLTIDSIENLSLQGMKLVITYEDSTSKDPIRQPDLSVDTVLDDLRSEDTRVIRIQRADNKEYEIWYRSLLADMEEVKQHKSLNKQAQTESSDADQSTSNINDNTTSEESFSGADDTIITNSMPLEIKESQEEDEAENQVTINDQIIKNDEQSEPSTHRPIDTSWNFVAGRELVNDVSPVASKDSMIFWLDARGGTLYAFNIATQGIGSRSYNPQTGDDYIIYRNPSSQEKKVIFDFSSKQFIFP